MTTETTTLSLNLAVEELTEKVDKLIEQVKGIEGALASVPDEVVIKALIERLNIGESVVAQPSKENKPRKRDRSRAPVLSKPLTEQEQRNLDVVYDILLVFCKERATVHFTSEDLWNWLEFHPHAQFRNEAGDPLERLDVERAFNASESGQFDVLQVGRVLGKIETRSVRDKTPSFVAKRIGQAGKRHWTFTPLSDEHGVLEASIDMPEVAAELKEFLAVDHFTAREVATQLEIPFDEKKFPYMARLRLNPKIRTGNKLAVPEMKRSFSKATRLYFQDKRDTDTFRFKM